MLAHQYLVQFPATGPSSDTVTLLSTGASSALIFYVLFKCSPYLSNACSSTYTGLSQKDRVDWDSRWTSTIHALAISALAMYLFLLTDPFSDDTTAPELWKTSPLKRHTPLSSAALGWSLGYFTLDIALVCWYFPTMGGPEMLIHHIAAFISVGLASYTKQAHMYTLLLLSTEMTTPFVNARWILDQMGLRSAPIYALNGVCMFTFWFVGRIVLFMWFFQHMWQHQAQIRDLRSDVQLLMATVPPFLFVLNVFWFGKIVKGLVKLLRGQLSKLEDTSPRLVHMVHTSDKAQ